MVIEGSIMDLFSWVGIPQDVRLPGSVQFSAVAQSCPTLCDPMNCSTPGLPVYHQLLEFTQTHVHRVGDAIQPSHPLQRNIQFSSVQSLSRVRLFATP